MTRLLSVLSFLAACGGGADPDGDHTGGATTGSGTAAGGTGGGTTEGGLTLPPDPRPLTLTFTGAIDETLVFDAPTCSSYPYPSYVNFRTFWRGSSHNAVLIAEVLGDFEGAGTYDTASNGLRVKLQTEMGSTLVFDPIAVETTLGDSATMQVDGVGDIAYGTFTVSAMHDSNGVLVDVSPSAIPIWCETVEN